MQTVGDYLNGCTPEQKAMFKKIKKMVHEIVPGATERVSYGIPTFEYKKKYLLYFGAFKNHMSLFPASDDMIEALGESVGKFRSAKGTLRFTHEQPIPDDVIEAIIRFRLANISS